MEIEETLFSLQFAINWRTCRFGYFFNILVFIFAILLFLLYGRG